MSNKIGRADMVREVLRLLDNFLYFKHDEESKKFVLEALKNSRTRLAEYDKAQIEIKEARRAITERKKLFGAFK